MRFLIVAPLALGAVAVACSSSNPSPGPDAAAPLPPADTSCAGPCPASGIKHLVVVVQENHTFETHFGRYCTAPAGSAPRCTEGPACCEGVPAWVSPVTIDDAEMGSRDPDHTAACESAEMNGGAMDRYAAGAPGCSDPRNVGVGDPAILKPYWDLAAEGALADRYFQPVVGQSYANDMFLARAQFVFADNAYAPKGALGVECSPEAPQKELTGTTLGDLLNQASVPWAFFMGGYDVMKEARAAGGCPLAPDECGFGVGIDPCVFEPSDDPFEFYASTRDDAAHIADLAALDDALDHGGLPAVSFVKAIEYKSEHPGLRERLSDGVAFVAALADHVQRSPYRDDTLFLLTYDEGGGYYDHVAPPPPSDVDHQPYGTRVPLLAVGPFARTNHVSHVTMEHSSLVKFIEWNWLGGQTGQLKGRDAAVANIGSLLDPVKTTVPVPEN
jgi:phospholipase C